MLYPDLRSLYALLKREPVAPDLGDHFITLLREIVPSRRQLRQLTLYLISAQTRLGLDAPLINLVPYYFLSTPEWSRVPTPTLLEIIKRSQPGHEREWLLLCLPPHAIAPYASSIGPIRWIARYIQVNAHRDIDAAALLRLGNEHSWPHDSWCSVLMRAVADLEYDDAGVIHSTWITDDQMEGLVNTVGSKIHNLITAKLWCPKLAPTHAEFYSRFFGIFIFFLQGCVSWDLMWDHADDILSWNATSQGWLRKSTVIRHCCDSLVATQVRQMTLIQHRVLAAVACLGDDLIRVRGSTQPARFFRILQQLPPEMVNEVMYLLFGYNHAGPVHDTAIAWALSAA